MSALTVRGRVDTQGLLVSADAPLLRLQYSAGAGLAQTIAMPQLAQIISAVLASKQSLSRPVMMGDHSAVIRGVAHIAVHGDGADIAIQDWQAVNIDARRDAMPTLLSPMGWTWETDANLNLLALRVGASAPLAAADWSGRPMTEVLQLNSAPDGHTPILAAQHAAQRFVGQSVTTMDRAVVRHEMILNGVPLFDALGCLRGFRGSAEPAPSMDITLCPHFQKEDDYRFELGFNKRVDDALRQPINQIISTAVAIANEGVGPIRTDYARYAGDIAQAGRHLLGLIDDLAEVQSIESAHFTTVDERLDLGELVRRAAGLISVQAEAKNITLYLSPASGGHWGIGEHRRVLQILINLLGNAVRYSANGTQITVTVERIAAQIYVAVSDQGPGISPEHQPKIFEKFERLGRRDSGGSGLGLYIARKLARAMGGDLQVFSQLGRGACFSLILNAAAET